MRKYKKIRDARILPNCRRRCLNGRPFERRVRVPDYLLSLEFRDGRTEIKAPLVRPVEAFVKAVQHKKITPQRAGERKQAIYLCDCASWFTENPARNSEKPGALEAARNRRDYSP